MANAEIDVSEEAQKRLCRFSYLSHVTSTMEDRVGFLKKKVSTLQDATEEVEVALTDDDLWIKVGECYFAQSSAPVEEFLTAATEDARSQLSEIQRDLSGKRLEMQDLKVKLYAEFGNKVNLDK